MTSKTDFTDEEWTRLKRAPFVAGMAISLADPGGPIEAVKETAATLKTVTRRRAAAAAASSSARSRARSSRTPRQRKNPLGGFKPTKGATAGVEILDELARGQPHRHREGHAEDAAACASGCSRRAGGGRTRPRRAASSASTPSA